MRNSLKLTAFLGMFAFIGSPAFAGEDCKCRAGGENYNTGSVICLKIGSTSQLARCEMSLNNTSWKTLGQECPYALLQSPVQSTNQSLISSDFYALARAIKL